MPRTGQKTWLKLPNKAGSLEISSQLSMEIQWLKTMIAKNSQVIAKFLEQKLDRLLHTRSQDAVCFRGHPTIPLLDHVSPSCATPRRGSDASVSWALVSDWTLCCMPGTAWRERTACSRFPAGLHIWIHGLMQQTTEFQRASVLFRARRLFCGMILVQVLVPCRVVGLVAVAWRVVEEWDVVLDKVHIAKFAWVSCFHHPKHGNVQSPHYTLAQHVHSSNFNPDLFTIHSKLPSGNLTSLLKMAQSK